MRYFLLRRQKGAGCDYTIGCGLTFHEIDADNMDEAIEQVIDLPDDWESITDEDELSDMICDTGLSDVEPGEFEMDAVRLFEVSDSVNLIPILKKKLAEVEAHKASLQAKEQEEAERAQYEKLKKKFAK